MKRSKPTRRDLLLVVGKLQSQIGEALAFHRNDRDRNGFEAAGRKLEEAQALCVGARSFDAPIDTPESPNARGWP